MPLNRETESNRKEIMIHLKTFNKTAHGQFDKALFYVILAQHLSR